MRGYGHVTAQCLSRNLLIKEVDNDEIETIVHEATRSATDSNDEVRVASIQLGVVKYPHTQLLVTKIGASLVCSTPILHMKGKTIN